MGLIICTERGKDEFVWWSTIADGPMGFGTREELKDRIAWHGDVKECSEDRFDRASELGSSMMRGAAGMPEDYVQEGWWDDNGFVVEQRGWLPRAKLGEFMRLYSSGDKVPQDAYDMLEPFEDNE